MEICGFISVADVGSPSAVSRHLVLPLPTDKTANMQGISLEEESDNEDTGDDGKIPSFCVLLHGALKVKFSTNFQEELREFSKTYLLLTLLLSKKNQF